MIRFIQSEGELVHVQRNLVEGMEGDFFSWLSWSLGTQQQTAHHEILFRLISFFSEQRPPDVFQN